MENIVVPEDKPQTTWMLLMYMASVQPTYNKPYMNGSNNIYLWGAYNNEKETRG